MSDKQELPKKTTVEELMDEISEPEELQKIVEWYATLFKDTKAALNPLATGTKEEIQALWQRMTEIERFRTVQDLQNLQDSKTLTREIMELAKQAFDNLSNAVNIQPVKEEVDAAFAELNNTLAITLERLKKKKLVPETAKIVDGKIIDANEEEIQEIISVRSKRPTEMRYSLDKVSNTAFGNFFSILGVDPNKEPVALKAEKQGSKKEVSMFFSIDFDAVKEQFPNIKILDRLTYYDKRVYLAVAALWYSGNEYITVRQIYNAMGRSNYKKEDGLKTEDRKPSEKIREKILNSLKKLLAPIVLDNHEEIEAGYNYPKTRYTGTFLPIEFVDADKPVKINGVLVRDAIHILREPPLTQFARIRNQITTVTPILFDTPYSMTEENLAIDDYIFTRCRRAKKDSITIRLDTLYTAVGITTAKQKQRAPEKLTKHLEHFKNCGEISKYDLDLENGKIYLKLIKKDTLPEEF